jgi:primosomal protein N' (replication factor Y)
MVNAGLLEPVLVDSDRPYPAPDPRHAVPDLSDQQREAAAKFVAAVEEHAFRPFLLDGVTGSGKTETYFEAIARAIGSGSKCWCCCPKSR